jgi:hypothetical protein
MEWWTQGSDHAQPRLAGGLPVLAFDPHQHVDIRPAASHSRRDARRSLELVTGLIEQF